MTSDFQFANPALLGLLLVVVALAVRHLMARRTVRPATLVHTQAQLARNLRPPGASRCAPC